MQVWGGHSCPPLLKLILTLRIVQPLSSHLRGRVFATEVQVKGGGQECPPHII